MLDSLKTVHVWHNPPLQQRPALSCHCPLSVGFCHLFWLRIEFLAVWVCSQMSRVLFPENGCATHTILSSPSFLNWRLPPGSTCALKEEPALKGKDENRGQTWPGGDKNLPSGLRVEGQGRRIYSQSPGERQGIPDGKLLNLLWHPLYKGLQLERWSLLKKP